MVKSGQTTEGEREAKLFAGRPFRFAAAGLMWLGGDGGFVLSSVSGVRAHSQARLEALGFIPTQWVTAAALADCAGGFKTLIQPHSGTLLADQNESREANRHTLIITVCRRLKRGVDKERLL